MAPMQSQDLNELSTAFNKIGKLFATLESRILVDNGRFREMPEPEISAIKALFAEINKTLKEKFKNYQVTNKLLAGLADYDDFHFPIDDFLQNRYSWAANNWSSRIMSIFNTLKRQVENSEVVTTSKEQVTLDDYGTSKKWANS